MYKGSIISKQHLPAKYSDCFGLRTLADETVELAIRV